MLHKISEKYARKGDTVRRISPSCCILHSNSIVNTKTEHMISPSAMWSRSVNSMASPPIGSWVLRIRWNKQMPPICHDRRHSCAHGCEFWFIAQAIVGAAIGRPPKNGTFFGFPAGNPFVMPAAWHFVTQNARTSNARPYH